MRLTIQAGTVTEYKNGSEITENIYYQNVDELMKEFEKQKSEFKNPNVTENEIMKFAEKSQDSKRIQKLGKYEDIDENPEHLADIKKALEFIKNTGILKPYETSGGQCWLETMCDAIKIPKETYNLFKKVML